MLLAVANASATPIWQIDTFWVAVSAVISAMVAAATFSLAVSTKALADETREVLRGEERRHQQSYAPLLTLVLDRVEGDDTTLDREPRLFFRANVQNDGQGIATNVQVTLTGAMFPRPPDGVKRQYEQPQQRPINSNEQKHNIAFVPKGLNRGLFFLMQKGMVRVNLDVVIITYRDMFENEYETRYENFSENPNKATWIRPLALARQNKT